MSKVDVLSLAGKKVKQIDLPKVFQEEVNTDLIRRAVLASQSAGLMPFAPNKNAGRKNTAEYEGCRLKPQRHRTINIGHARKPRLKNRRYITAGQVAGIPAVVGGPKAHPPKTEKVLKDKINKKEKRKALASAIAASANKKLVRERGHKFGESLAFPVIVEGKIEELAKTKEFLNVLNILELSQDVERAKSGRKIRAGNGRMRGRKYKKIKSLLLVVEKSDKVYKAARNIEGLDVVQVKDLNAELLAPGTSPGRLTVWSENAINNL